MSNYEKNDNTRVKKLVKRPQFKRTISSEEKEQMKQQGYIWDGEKWVFMGTISQGEGSPDNSKTLQEKAKNYWKFSGASDRWKTSWKAGQNPIKGALNVGLGYTHPMLAGANTLYDMYNAYNQLSSSQGLAKTWGLIRSGNLGKAAVSAAGDALVTSDLIPGMPEIPSVRPVSIPEIRIPNRENFTGDIVIPAMNITDNPIDMSRIRSASNTNSANREVIREILRTSPNPTNNVQIQSSPSLDNFNSRLQSLISEATSNRERQILQQMLEGNWVNADQLFRRKYDDLIKIHPDSRYLNNSSHYDNLQQLIAIQKLRNSFKEGLAPTGDNVAKALGNNPYDDNPLIEELGRSNFTDNYDILPSETRILFEQEWDPANNHIINNMMESNYVVPHNHPYRILRNRFTTNYELPLEYRHLDTDVYGSYPLEYYTGSETPNDLNIDDLLKYGILGNTSGLFTEEQLKNLTPEILDKFQKRSSKLNVEGAHGQFFSPYSNPQKQALQYLLTKGQQNNAIMGGLKKSNRSGYINVPHSLSIDSWPIWELQSLRHSNNTIPISPELFGRTEYARYIPYRNGHFWGVTNTFGIGNRIEASSELQQFIKTHQHDKLDANDFTITPIDDQVSKISHRGNNIGTLKMLNYDETLNKFNEVRRKLYRSDPSKYPGDAEAYGLSREQGDFRFAVPFIPTQLKKKGGKLNVRLVKRNTN